MEFHTVSPFQGLEKAAVLQECRIFHDSQIVIHQPRKCCQLITKLLHILTQGESFSSGECTEVFFGVTKLFQSKDVSEKLSALCHRISLITGISCRPT